MQRLNVAACLRGLGLERYEAVFRANDTDAAVLPGFTAGDLRDVSVASFGHRRTFCTRQRRAALRPRRSGGGRGGCRVHVQSSYPWCRRRGRGAGSVPGGARHPRRGGT
ncbi:MAG: hypothetical protein ICV73_30965 [Acetobacteraceae bacterium]|nr:hypothetical protein [Acetobacteraceae bacterium]